MTPETTSSSAAAFIEVHTLKAPERRMLLEMLASERAGEPSLYVGYFGREKIATALVDLHMSRWAGADYVTLSDYGRHVAESLAARLVERAPLFVS